MAKEYEVIVSTLNVRSGPGTKYEDIADVYAGDVLYGVEGWIPIQVEDGTVGWVSEQFVKLVEVGPEPPVESPKPVPRPKPSPGKVIYQSQLQALYGTPRDPAPYLKVMDFTEFKPAMGPIVDYEGNRWGFRIYGHELIEAPLRAAFKNLIARGYSAEWRTYEGCLNIRPRTGGGGYSTHAWGLAIDLNAGANRYGHEPTLSEGFVECFEDAGFEWGGRWRTPDGMHFQIPRTS